MQYQACSVVQADEEFLSILIVYCRIHDSQYICYMHLVWDSFLEIKPRNEDGSENIAKKKSRYNIDSGSG